MGVLHSSGQDLARSGSSACAARVTSTTRERRATVARVFERNDVSRRPHGGSNTCLQHAIRRLETDAQSDTQYLESRFLLCSFRCLSSHTEDFPASTRRRVSVRLSRTPTLVVTSHTSVYNPLITRIPVTLRETSQQVHSSGSPEPLPLGTAAASTGECSELQSEVLRDLAQVSLRHASHFPRPNRPGRRLREPSLSLSLSVSLSLSRSELVSPARSLFRRHPQVPRIQTRSMVFQTSPYGPRPFEYQRSGRQKGRVRRGVGAHRVLPYLTT